MSVARTRPPLPSEVDIAAFRDLVWQEGRAHWRELPWRGIDDPYAVLVSEIMLQQTQVKRVLRYWPRFMEVFPSIDALASAETSLVLEMWQGLGYNRRALMLKRCADVCALQYGGALPDSREDLLALPGIGPATASGVQAFARNQPCVYLETNVRSVFIHCFFPDVPKVPDSLIAPIAQLACPHDDARNWYYALLDYGAHLKTTVPNPSRRSSAYARQSAFEGSRRQKRAQLVRIVLGEPGIGREELARALDEFELGAGRPPVDPVFLDGLLHDLVEEGFFSFDGRGFQP